MSTRGSIMRQLEERLAAAGIDTAAAEAAWIVSDVLGLDRADLVGWPDHPVDPAKAEHALRLAERRAAREPLQYVLGYAEFHGRRFHVDPSVLIPRPETEELVERTLEAIPPGRPVTVLDAGTGSGCIAVTIALERPTACVTACDVSPEALATARSNAVRLGADVRFARADMTDPDFPEAVGGPYDVVVSNPPYVDPSERDTLDPEVRLHEPPVALFGEGDPIRCFRALAGHVADRLATPAGLLVVEIHAKQGERVAGVFRKAGLERVSVEADSAGRNRFCRGFRSLT